MKNLITGLILLVAVSLIFTQQVLAGGFQINEHGAKAMGMGGAFTAQANDPSAIFFNPAGLGFQKGMKVMLGTTLMFPSTTFTEPTPLTTETKMKSQIFYPSNLYGTYAMDESFVFGLGVYNHYGLGTEWPDMWVGRQLAVKTDLKTYFINPSAAYKINDEFSLGIGLSYVFASVELINKIIATPLGITDGKLDMEADGTGFNLNAGLLYKPMPELAIGLSYRHSTEIKFEGDANFTNMGAGAALFPNQKGSTTITLPSNLMAGIAYNIMPEFTIEAGFQYVGWNSYDTLKIDFEKNTAALGDIKSIKAWENSFLIRLGGEYRLDQLSLRAGYVYDQTPQPDKAVEPMLPDANRNEFVFGIGYKLTDELNLDFAYQLIMAADRTVTYPTNPFPGTYKSSAHMFGINVGYQF
ncbi:MAG: outer membrane protein transport protein [Bacteroidota bacterium]|nr:outer membrane protein transport protein [Bacteroidota bacterium]